MPRFLVVLVFALLTFGIIVGGGFLLWQQFSNQGSPAETGESTGPLFGALPAAEKSNISPAPSPANPEDNDNDGLSNSDEATWKSNPDNPDTDGDGYLDGEEVVANHDPTIPAPNDRLQPNTNNQPTGPTGKPPLTQEALDQYFADDVDLTGGTENLTEKYNAQYSEENRSPATMSDFARQQPVISQLPHPDSNLLPEGKENSASMLSYYLSIVDNPGVLANSSSYISAQYELYNNNDPTAMRGISRTIRDYRNSLSAIPVPQTAVPLHTFLLGYTELLSATFDQIAQRNEDPVKSLVATRQLEVIDRQYYPIINQELQRLQALQ